MSWLIVLVFLDTVARYTKLEDVESRDLTYFQEITRVEETQALETHASQSWVL